jgi:hypothetical protein
MIDQIFLSEKGVKFDYLLSILVSYTRFRSTSQEQTETVGGEENHAKTIAAFDHFTAG